MAVNVDQLHGEQSRETAARLLVTPEAARPRTPQEQAVVQLRTIIEKNPPSPLDELAIKPVSSEKVATAIDKTISADRNATTQKKDRPAGSEHARKFDRATNAAKLSQDFLKVGYHRMPEWQKQIYREETWKAMRRVYPDVVRAWAGMSEDQQKLQMDKMLRDPEFAKHVATILEGVVDGAQEPKQLPQELLDRVNQTKLEYDTKQKETEWAQNDYDRVKSEYEREYVTKGAGSRGQDLDAMRPMAVLEREYTIAVNRLNTEKARLDQLREEQAAARGIRDAAVQAAELTRIAGEIAAQQGRINTAQGAVDTAAENRDKRKALDDDKKRLEDELRRLERELSQKQIQFRQAETAYFGALADKNDAEEDIRRAEQEFISKLEGVMKKATEEWTRGELQHYEEARDQLLREAGDQALIDGLQRRWNINRGKKAPEFNKDTINDDYSELIRNGPDAVIVRALVAGGMKESDARLKLANDKEFKERATRDVVDRLLTRKLQTGKITESEVMRIVDSPWGVDALQNALEQKARYTGELDRLKEAGLLQGGFIDKLKGLPRNKWMLILAALLGLGVYGVGVGPLIDLIGEGAHEVSQNYGKTSFTGLGESIRGGAGTVKDWIGVGADTVRDAA